MKKLFSILLCLILALTVFAGCSKNKTNNNDNNENKNTSESDVTTVDTMPTVLDTTEYMLYQNIFYNEQGADYDGKDVTKKGTYAIVYDEYNSATRYYVWGYNDQTKCCDWQWEFTPADESTLSGITTGSLIEVKGTFASNENALDGYWIDNANVTVTQAYKGNDCAVDMTAMGETLERVQLANMQNFPEKFEGKTVSAYGRVETPTSVQHPYYDNCFSQQFETSDTIPAIGTEIIVKGTYQNGVIVNATVNETNQY